VAEKITIMQSRIC